MTTIFNVCFLYRFCQKAKLGKGKPPRPGKGSAPAPPQWASCCRTSWPKREMGALGLSPALLGSQSSVSPVCPPVFDSCLRRLRSIGLVVRRLTESSRDGQIRGRKYLQYCDFWLGIAPITAAVAVWGELSSHSNSDSVMRGAAIHFSLLWLGLNIPESVEKQQRRSEQIKKELSRLWEACGINLESSPRTKQCQVKTVFYTDQIWSAGHCWQSRGAAEHKQKGNVQAATWGLYLFFFLRYIY